MRKSFPIRIAAGAVLGLALVTGSAFSQAADSAIESLPAASDYFMSDDTKDFYADDSRATMRSEAEMKTAFSKMSPEQQKKLREACAADTAGKYAPLCKVAM